MTFTRRAFVQLSLGSAVTAGARQLLAQGVAAHTAKPVTRPAPSGRPFDARFVDVGAAAGLNASTIYGGVESKKYILEATGCGCAFFDFDNDGWMDIFLLCGTRLDGAPADASNRLYKNNRDGTFTDVTEKAGLRLADWASAVCIGDYNNDGFEDIFCTCFGQNHLYRNN
ncbi:MAG TPA: VCBS repeat-containing protein, partial [Terriglobales bacterium]|nr:VCBS repeat-containing protein [Terriglobales bacterium]